MIWPVVGIVAGRNIAFALGTGYTDASLRLPAFRLSEAISKPYDEATLAKFLRPK